MILGSGNVARSWLAPTALALTLTACGVVPTGGPSVTPDRNAIVSRETTGRTTTLIYDKTLMNRAEAETLAQDICEEDGLTLEVFRHPAPSSGPTSNIIFTCRQPFG